MKLADFNRLVKKSPTDALDLIVQKHFFHGIPVVFNGDEDAFFDFRNRIASQYGLSFHEVFIVGSAKMGFSYVKKRDTFDFDSDVDVAIVSDKLFEEYSLIIREFQYSIKNGGVSLTQRQMKTYTTFLTYFARGWIRPDMAKIIMSEYDLVKNWGSFFKSISYDKSEVGNYKVAAGVFKSYDYLQRYHLEGLKKHQQAIARV